MDEALAELLGDRRTGDLRQDLILAGREAWRRRQVNTEAGGTVIGAMRAEPLRLPWKTIERYTGIPDSTAQNWHRSPTGARYVDEERSEDDN